MIRKIIYSPTFRCLTNPNPINISDMATFQRNKTHDSKVAVIVFIVVLNGMGVRPFTVGFLNRSFLITRMQNVGIIKLSMKILMSSVVTLKIGRNLFEMVVCW